MAEADDSLELEAQPSTPSNYPEKSSCASDSTRVSEHTKSSSSPWHCSSVPHSRIVTDQLEQATFSPSIAPFNHTIQHRSSPSEAKHVSPPLSPSLCPHRFALSKLQLHDLGMSSSPNGYGTTVGGTAAGIPSNGGHTDIAATGVELQLHAQPSHAHKRTRHCIGSDDAPSWACMSPHMDVERTSIEPFLTYQSSMLPPIVPMQTTLDSTMSTSSMLPTQTECPTPYENPLGFGPQGFDVFTSGVRMSLKVNNGLCGY